MAKKKANDIKLADFPEEVTEEGLKIYGETSYENIDYTPMERHQK